MLAVRGRKTQVHIGEDGDSSMIDIPLLEIEAGMMSWGDAIHTINFYEGDIQSASTYLKERLTLVADKNPWITGHLVNHKTPEGKQGMSIRYSKNNYKDRIASIFEVCDKDALDLNESMKYSVMCGKVTNPKSTAFVDKGINLVKSGKPFCKLTLAPITSGKFCVIWALSHTVADGFTYYTLMNMMGKDAEIFEMIVQRDEKLRESQPSWVGEKEYEYMLWTKSGLNCGAVCNALGAYSASHAPAAHCFILDENRLKDAKEKAKAEFDAAPYVSTNDIFTCGFAKVINAKILSMGIDFRGRIPGLTSKHAGCYQLGLLWGSEGYQSPNIIRKALTGEPPLSRATIPTTCMGRTYGNFTGSITNWATFANGNGLEITDCTLSLHLPCVNVAEAIFDLAVIFKPRPGQVAAMIFVQNPTEEDLRRELPIGKKVSETLFAK